jgi:hypothetical protein
MRLATLLVVTIVASCSCVEPPPRPLTFVEGCSPLLASSESTTVDCGLPYPDDFFLTDDASTPSGKRIVFVGPAKMATANIPVRSADIMETFAADGFSRLTPIVWSFGVRVDPEALPGIFDDAALTLAPGFATALIESGTGRRVPHFIDVDPRAVDNAREALVMHPLETLNERTRYIVAISGVVTPDGSAVAPPEAFRRLRDNNTGDDPVLAPLLARYQADVFPAIVDAGIARAALQLAWDFTTGSEANATTGMLQARAQAIAELERTAPVLAIDAIFEGDDLELILQGSTDTWRMIKGSLIGPRIVDDDGPGARLALDDAGAVRLDGTTRFDFTVIVPASVRDSAEPASVLLFGHGFFGNQGEVEGSATRAVADHAGVVMIAIDWQGMSSDDIGDVVASVGGEVSRSILFGERVMQGMVNWQTLTRALKLGVFDATLSRPTGEVFIDLDRPLGFLGISQGHVLGGTLSALNADIDRSILMVGGANLAAMMFRARPFERFLSVLDITVPDPLEEQKIAAHMQSQFDRFDPATFAPYVQHTPLPLGPDNGRDGRQVLMMMGIGDTQVPNLGTELHARALGIPQLMPSALGETYGIATADFPAESGFVVYDFGIDPSFGARAAPAESENLVHEAVRRVPEAKDQMRDFLKDGVIKNFCGGPCVVAAP